MIGKLKILKSFYPDVLLLGAYPRETFTGEICIRLFIVVWFIVAKSLSRKLYVVYSYNRVLSSNCIELHVSAQRDLRNIMLSEKY